MSCDITPPLTPVELEEMEEDWDVDTDWPDPEKLTTSESKPFSCQGNRIQCLNQGECRLQQLTEFLKQMDMKIRAPLPHHTELFGYQFVSNNFMDHAEKLSLFLRQWIAKLQTSFMVSGQEAEKWRQDILVFFEFLKSYLLRQESADGQRGLQVIISHLHGCLLYLDRLSNIHYDSTSTNESREYNHFHLCLDVYWKLLEVLHLITTRHKGFSYCRQLSCCVTRYSGEDRTAFTQVLQLVIWELCTAAFSIYNKATTLDFQSCTPFPCSCVKELWSLILALIKHRDRHAIGEPFWVHIHYVVQTLLEQEQIPTDMEIDTDVYLYPDEEKFRGDNSKFCFWILTHLATLNCTPKNNKSRFTSESNYHGLMTVIKKCLSKGDVQEGDLRFYLQCCVELGAIWEPNINPILAFWDYFYHRLNNNFQVNVGFVDGLANMCQSSSAMLELCTRLGGGQYQYKSSDTSFQIFLGLLGSHLRDFLDSGSTQEWRQIKGRVYSKFHLRRMQELTETGLYNFSVLFLCLGQAALNYLEDVTGKLLDFYDMLDASHLKMGKTRIVWMSMFALLMLHQQRDLDSNFITDRLGKAFTVAAMEFSTSGDFDPGYRHQLWKLLQFYLESLQVIFESTSKVEPSQHLLITDGFTSLIKTCRHNELATVMSTVHAIISNIRQHKKTDALSSAQSKHLQDLHTAMWINVLPAVKSMSNSLTAPDQIADALAGLCLMAFDSNNTDFVSLVKFVQGNTINKSICCRFWCHMLPVEGVLPALSQKISNFQTSIIQTWISCTIFLPASSPQLIAFNRSMMAVDDVLEMMTQSGQSVTDNTYTCLHFVKALDVVFSKTQVWKDRIKLQEKAMMYFSDVQRQITPILQAMKAGETLSNVYAAVGFIIKSCAQMLFIQSKPNCPLPSLIDSMVVPHFLFKQDKAVNPVFLSVIREHLHLFVRGLGRLDYKKAPYVQRKLGDIVSIYLPKFWTTGMSMGTASTVHPLVAALKRSFVRHPTEAEMAFRQFLLEIVLDKFLKPINFTLPLNHAQALLFLKEIISRTTSKESIARDSTVLLDGVLTVMNLSSVMSTQQCAQQIASQLLEAASTCSHVLPQDGVRGTLDRFVTYHQKTHLDQAIKTLEQVSMSGATFIKQILPRIQHLIVQHESHRGTGCDSKLRQSYVSLMKAAGGSPDKT